MRHADRGKRNPHPVAIHSTYQWQRIARHTLAVSRICGWCGHPGANQADHIIPVSERPDLALDPDNVAPIHGASIYIRGIGWRKYGCPTCGRPCNQAKGSTVDGVPPSERVSESKPSREW